MNYETFTTQVLDCNISGLNKHLGVPELDVNTGPFKSTVYWSLEPDARERGIKCITISVQRVTSSIQWEVDEEELSSTDLEKLIAAGGMEMRRGPVAGEIIIDSDKRVVGSQWTITDELRFAPDGAIMPEQVNFDFDNFIISVA